MNFNKTKAVVLFGVLVAAGSGATAWAGGPACSCHAGQYCNPNDHGGNCDTCGGNSVTRNKNEANKQGCLSCGDGIAQANADHTACVAQPTCPTGSPTLSGGISTLAQSVSWPKGDWGKASVDGTNIKCSYEVNVLVNDGPPSNGACYGFDSVTPAVTTHVHDRFGWVVTPSEINLKSVYNNSASFPPGTNMCQSNPTGVAGQITTHFTAEAPLPFSGGNCRPKGEGKGNALYCDNVTPLAAGQLSQAPVTGGPPAPAPYCQASVTGTQLVNTTLVPSAFSGTSVLVINSTTSTIPSTSATYASFSDYAQWIQGKTATWTGPWKLQGQISVSWPSGKPANAMAGKWVAGSTTPYQGQCAYSSSQVVFGWQTNFTITCPNSHCSF